MIRSMTGYGREAYEDDGLSLDIEVKSINSRYLDISIRMPNQFNFLEDKIRKLIKEKISRGRVDVFIRTTKRNITKSNINVDLDAALDMKEKLESIIKHTGIHSRVSLNDILRNEDVLSYEAEDLDQEYIANIILSSLSSAIDDLKEMKSVEGQNLKKELSSLINGIEDNLSRIKELSKDFTSEYKEKLEESIARLVDDKSVIDEDRLATEIVFYADRADIQEEIARMASHIDQFRKALNASSPIGKKLDFITQEMLRETNTIGSKASKEEITIIVIEQKTLIEKVKEQVQNIE